MFSFGHLFSLFLIFTAIVFLYRYRDKLKQERVNRLTRYCLAGLLLLSDLALNVWFLVEGSWTLDYNLPLQLCTISLYLSAFMLITRSLALFEFAFLIGIGGALQALLTPDLGHFSYPHFRTYQFFIAHGAILVAGFYMVFVEGFRPTLHSIWRSILMLNIIALLVGLANWLTGGNYMFLAHKPGAASLLDLLGPWPYYIIWLEAVVLVSVLLFYLPFGVQDFRRKRKGSGN
ncbi:TIGR02206 family membrane protein [Tumebacillus algifaecis]|uniref:TIGR02206 family membrane protein n=2 Tax=Tumebacillus algifaecis TaxID=1214604 RepID=A0A223D692_9BACL|nr:TIGR02206 family membrane protein [Tumebacillus algifaecis]